MRRVLFAAAAAVTVLIGGFTAVTPARAAVTVVNPDFNATGGTATPPGWTASGTASASYTEATSSGYNGDAYQLTHWAPGGYDVTTSQRLTGLSPGYFTLGGWVRSSGGDISNSISLTGCGGPDART